MGTLEFDDEGTQRLLQSKHRRHRCAARSVCNRPGLFTFGSLGIAHRSEPAVSLLCRSSKRILSLKAAGSFASQVLRPQFTQHSNGLGSCKEALPTAFTRCRSLTRFIGSLNPLSSLPDAFSNASRRSSVDAFADSCAV